MDLRWEPGTFVAFVRLSNEYVIMTTRGFIKAHAIKRVPEEEGWSKDSVASMKGNPWKPVPGQVVTHILLHDGTASHRHGGAQIPHCTLGRAGVVIGVSQSQIFA